MSRSELVLLVSPFLNKVSANVAETPCSFSHPNFTFQHPELMKWFKDFVGFRDGAGGMGSGSEQMSSSDSQRLRPERLIGDSAMEIGEISLHTQMSACLRSLLDLLKQQSNLFQEFVLTPEIPMFFLPGGRSMSIKC